MSEPQMFVPYQQKTETRKGGKFEDVQRPNQQTFMHGLMRFAQIGLTLLAAYLWAKVAQVYRHEPVTGEMSDLLNGTIWVVTLALAVYLVARILSSVEADRNWTIFIALACVAGWLLFNLAFTPVAVFAVLMLEKDAAYLLPIIATAAAAAFVPSLEIGRLSFWRELIDQSGANSEKPVIDETAIVLKQMEIDWQREQAEAREAALQAEIDRLTAILQTPQPQVIDGEPTFPGQRTIEDCIRPIKVNGHWEYDAMTRNGPRRLDSTLLLQFVTEAWGYNRFDRRYWLERGVKRDDWEAMRGAVDWALRDNKVIRGIDDVVAELLRFGVIMPALRPTPPVENDASPSRPK